MKNEITSLSTARRTLDGKLSIIENEPRSGQKVSNPMEYHL